MFDRAKHFNYLSDELSKIGADPKGGVTRLLYTKEWVCAQEFLQKKFEEAGLTASSDSVGNLSGRLQGSKYPDEVIVSGSHIDTVVNGGNLDGQYGILAAFVAINYLKETFGTPLRSLEVLSLAEEEGSRFPYVFWGSKNIVGLADNVDVAEIVDANGKKFTQAMKDAGFSFPPEKSAVRDDIKAFVEIHIEQGSVLEREGERIGVVTSIVGQRRYTVTLKGEANHAGTTPMSYRKDTVYAFSKICYQSIEKAKKAGDPLVLTFGKVEPKPNTVNVVPGETVFTIDCRHTDEAFLEEFTTMLVKDILEICQALAIEAEINLWMDEPPIPMDPQLIEVLKDVCEKSPYSYRIMHSGAGHDSQIFAPKFPTAMFFVPSIKGISHNPAEFTKSEDLVLGVEVLSQILYQLAYQE